ncbi:hypothetical protein [Archaeoglobus sp.]|uniref:hypothetical protein n=1 Tax=Archaeoglobus sp. TaxID=1872626 RepID=UPI0025BDD3ED|nr:hypothetical protein [Archaeoglobus sp.]
MMKVPNSLRQTWNPFGVEPVMLVYFVNRLYDYKNPDEIRRPWNDKTIVPKKINGR